MDTLLIGIDPGFNNLGFAEYDPTNKKLVTCQAFTFDDWLPYIIERSKSYTAVACVLEAPNEKKHTFSGRGRGLNAAMMMRVSRNVGINQGAQLAIHSVMRMLRIPVLLVNVDERTRADGRLERAELHQLRMPTKIYCTDKATGKQKADTQRFARWTGHKTTSEHAMDAAGLVFGKAMKSVLLRIKLAQQQLAEQADMKRLERNRKARQRAAAKRRSK